MTNKTARTQIREWFSEDALPRLALLRSHIEGVEDQIELGIMRYWRDKKLGPTFPRNKSSIAAPRQYKGSIDNVYTFDEIVEEYFPFLQRTSAFVTIYSFLETELNALCQLACEAGQHRVVLSDLNGKGIMRARAYLEKVVGIDTYAEGKQWRELLAIQGVRNCLVHAEGLFNSIDNKQTKQYVRQSSLLSHETGIVTIEPGFLEHVIGAMRDYFLVIDHGLQKAFPPRMSEM